MPFKCIGLVTDPLGFFTPTCLSTLCLKGILLLMVLALKRASNSVVNIYKNLLQYTINK